MLKRGAEAIHDDHLLDVGQTDTPTNKKKISSTSRLTLYYKGHTSSQPFILLFLLFTPIFLFPMDPQQKVVLKVLTMTDDKTKKKAIEAAADIYGVDSIAADVTEQKLTVIGEMDAVAVVKKLKKVGKVDIISVGPAKEEKKEEKKAEKMEEKPEGKPEEKQEEKK
ncbi:hypothetical protein JHK85_029681 [Glycine max]|nr:hypothetical protein JHK85_029681 [Glycine max]KAG5004998.1 hypothetical protein JHK86_029137 [Glycine max]